MARKRKSDEDDSRKTLDRRQFLKTGIAAGAAAVTGSRRVSRASSSRLSEPAWEQGTLTELQDQMKAGSLTSAMLVEKYLSRIEEIDRGGPSLRSVIELNPDAMEIARRLDDERKSRGPRGLLHGIPVLIKDNIDTADRMSTTAGSLALAGSRPARDAFIVGKLREAGAVLLGKTNLSEWANFRSTHSTSGWSGRGGLTRNPYALDRNPCGSSSGSGVAVSAELCALAIGTETDGSIVCPSSANSIVGIKPTLGLISRSGIIPIAHSQDTAGPMARTVSDAAVLLGILAGMDPKDAATQASRGKMQTAYTRFLDPRGLRGARIGVARKFFGFNDNLDRLLQTLLDEMKRLGAEMVDPADIPTAGKFDDSELEVLLYEFKADLNDYLAGLGPGAPVRTLKDLIEFNRKNREREMPYFGQELFIKAEDKGPLTSASYLKALRRNHRMSRTEGIDAALSKHRLDALVAPTGGPPWTTDLVNGDHFTGGSSTPAAVAGYPSITVPAGYIFGLPVGLSFFGAAWSEPVLLRIAYAFEQATRVRRAPKFLQTADLTP
jgi:amidase